MLKAFALLMGVNYARHRRGLSTLCSESRDLIPTPVFIVAVCWFVPHWLMPKLSRKK